MDEYLNTLLGALDDFGSFLIALATEYPYVAAGVVIFYVMAFWFFRDKGEGE